MTPIAIEEPTVRMSFMVNKSPFAGQDPKSSRLTSRMIRDRLYKVFQGLLTRASCSAPSPPPTEGRARRL
jgi:predicted membrane GTPase involved in stress response